MNGAGGCEVEEAATREGLATSQWLNVFRLAFGSSLAAPSEPLDERTATAAVRGSVVAALGTFGADSQASSDSKNPNGIWRALLNEAERLLEQDQYDYALQKYLQLCPAARKLAASNPNSTAGNAGADAPSGQPELSTLVLSPQLTRRRSNDAAMPGVPYPEAISPVPSISGGLGMLTTGVDWSGHNSVPFQLRCSKVREALFRYYADELQKAASAAFNVAGMGLFKARSSLSGSSKDVRPVAGRELPRADRRRMCLAALQVLALSPQEAVVTIVRCLDPQVAWLDEHYCRGMGDTGGEEDASPERGSPPQGPTAWSGQGLRLSGVGEELANPPLLGAFVRGAWVARAASASEGISRGKWSTKYGVDAPHDHNHVHSNDQHGRSNGGREHAGGRVAAQGHPEGSAGRPADVPDGRSAERPHTIGAPPEGGTPTSAGGRSNGRPTNRDPPAGMVDSGVGDGQADSPLEYFTAAQQAVLSALGAQLFPLLEEVPSCLLHRVLAGLYWRRLCACLSRALAACLAAPAGRHPPDSPSARSQHGAQARSQAGSGAHSPDGALVVEDGSGDGDEGADEGASPQEVAELYAAAAEFPRSLALVLMSLVSDAGGVGARGLKGTVVDGLLYVGDASTYPLLESEPEETSPTAASVADEGSMHGHRQVAREEHLRRQLAAMQLLGGGGPSPLLPQALTASLTSGGGFGALGGMGAGGPLPCVDSVSSVAVAELVGALARMISDVLAAFDLPLCARLVAAVDSRLAATFPDWPPLGDVAGSLSGHGLFVLPTTQGVSLGVPVVGSATIVAPARSGSPRSQDASLDNAPGGTWSSHPAVTDGGGVVVGGGGSVTSGARVGSGGGGRRSTSSAVVGTPPYAPLARHRSADQGSMGKSLWGVGAGGVAGGGQPVTDAAAKEGNGEWAGHRSPDGSPVGTVAAASNNSNSPLVFPLPTRQDTVHHAAPLPPSTAPALLPFATSGARPFFSTGGGEGGGGGALPRAQAVMSLGLCGPEDLWVLPAPAGGPDTPGPEGDGGADDSMVSDGTAGSLAASAMTVLTEQAGREAATKGEEADASSNMGGCDPRLVRGGAANDGALSGGGSILVVVGSQGHADAAALLRQAALASPEEGQPQHAEDPSRLWREQQKTKNASVAASRQPRVISRRCMSVFALVTTNWSVLASVTSRAPRAALLRALLHASDAAAHSLLHLAAGCPSLLHPSRLFVAVATARYGSQLFASLLRELVTADGGHYGGTGDGSREGGFYISGSMVKGGEGDGSKYVGEGDKHAGVMGNASFAPSKESSASSSSAAATAATASTFPTADSIASIGSSGAVAAAVATAAARFEEVQRVLTLRAVTVAVHHVRGVMLAALDVMPWDAFRPPPRGVAAFGAAPACSLPLVHWHAYLAGLARDLAPVTPLEVTRDIMRQVLVASLCLLSDRFLSLSPSRAWRDRLLVDAVYVTATIFFFCHATFVGWEHKPAGAAAAGVGRGRGTSGMHQAAATYNNDNQGVTSRANSRSASRTSRQGQPRAGPGSFGSLDQREASIRGRLAEGRSFTFMLGLNRGAGVAALAGPCRRLLTRAALLCCPTGALLQRLQQQQQQRVDAASEDTCGVQPSAGEESGGGGGGDSPWAWLHCWQQPSPASLTNARISPPSLGTGAASVLAETGAALGTLGVGCGEGSSPCGRHAPGRSNGGAGTCRWCVFPFFPPSATLTPHDPCDLASVWYVAAGTGLQVGAPLPFAGSGGSHAGAGNVNGVGGGSGGGSVSGSGSGAPSSNGGTPAARSSFGPSIPPQQHHHHHQRVVGASPSVLACGAPPCLGCEGNLERLLLTLVERAGDGEVAAALARRSELLPQDQSPLTEEEKAGKEQLLKWAAEAGSLARGEQGARVP
eukprot:jgi/Mesvir1/16381/Mv18125-RA.1